MTLDATKYIRIVDDLPDGEYTVVGSPAFDEDLDSIPVTDSFAIVDPSTTINAAQSPLEDSSPDVLVDRYHTTLWDRITLSGDYGPYEVVDADFDSVALQVTDLNGSDAYAAPGLIPALQLTGDMSFGMWVNIDVNVAGRYALACGGGTELEIDNVLWSMRFNGAALEYIHEYSAGSNELYVFGSVLTTGTWMHIYMVRDDTAKTVECYVDGTLLDTFTYTNSATGGTNTQATIGRLWAQNSSHINGKVSDARIYNTALSAQEVQDIYDGKLIDTLPIAWWKLDDDAAGDVAYDSSGSGYDAAHVNTVLSVTASGANVEKLTNWRAKAGYTDDSGTIYPRDESNPTKDVNGTDLEFIPVLDTIRVTDELPDDEYTVIDGVSVSVPGLDVAIGGSFTVSAAVATGSASIDPFQSPMGDSSPNVHVLLDDGATLTGTVTLNDGSSSFGPYDVIVISTETYIEVDEVLADGTYTVEGTPAEDTLSGPLPVTGSFTIVASYAQITPDSTSTSSTPQIPVDLHNGATLEGQVYLTDGVDTYGPFDIIDP